MPINSKKTKDMLLSFRKSPTTPDSLHLGNCELERVNVLNCWNHHIEEMTKKANKRLFLLRECRKANLPKDVGIALYNTKIRPLSEYASPVWGGLPNYLSEEVQRVQDRSLSIIGVPKTALPALHGEGALLQNQYNLRFRRSTYIEMSGTDRHQRSFIPRAHKLCGK